MLVRRLRYKDRPTPRRPECKEGSAAPFHGDRARTGVTPGLRPDDSRQNRLAALRLPLRSVPIRTSLLPGRESPRLPAPGTRAGKASTRFGETRDPCGTPGNPAKRRRSAMPGLRRPVSCRRKRGISRVVHRPSLARWKWQFPTPRADSLPRKVRISTSSSLWANVLTRFDRTGHLDS